MKNTLADLIQEALKQLEELGLADGTLKSYRTRAFHPIETLSYSRYATCFCKAWLIEVENDFKQQYTDQKISRKSLNWRLRGISILTEIYDCGTFEWKVYSHKSKIQLTDFYEEVLHGFVISLSGSIKRRKNYESILRRFLDFISKQKIKDLSGINQLVVRDFIVDISLSKPKSMDDVMTALRQFFSYLNENAYCEETFWMLLSAPRTRDHRVRPCMKQNETNQLIKQVDRTTPEGKRDFAILTLAASTGLRAGDIASLTLTDIDWKKNELRMIQGKTDVILTLPLSKSVLAAVADYILNARPETTDKHLFIKSYAPYTNLQDGVSVASVFRKYLKAADIIHIIDDGRTMHGLRRAIGTQMVAEKVPVTTVAQVLGHTSIKATKQYISLDLEGLRKCVLRLDSIGGTCQ
jgi:site-specific recombinase XerD